MKKTPSFHINHPKKTSFLPFLSFFYFQLAIAIIIAISIKLTFTVAITTSSTAITANPTQVCNLRVFALTRPTT